MNSKVVRRNTLLWEINDCNNSFFYVKFIKRTDGTVREMRCRRGVKKHLKGGVASYDAAKKELIRVYEVGEGYKSIPVEGIISAKINGVRYIVQGMESSDVDTKDVEISDELLEAYVASTETMPWYDSVAISSECILGSSGWLNAQVSTM